MLDFKKSKLSGSGSDKVETIIGPRVVIQGDIRFSGGLYIEGKVIGKVVADVGVDSILTLAKDGCIEGEINAPQVVISGRLAGDLKCSERVELTESAHIQGNIHYKLIEITAGATVSGQLVHAVPQS